MNRDEDAPLPLAYWISRICEEFPCYGPAEAERAWRAAPAGWFEEIIEARSYAVNKAMYDRADTTEDQKRLPSSPLMDMVKAIDVDLAKAAMAERQQHMEGPEGQ